VDVTATPRPTSAQICDETVANHDRLIGSPRRAGSVDHANMRERHERRIDADDVARRAGWSRAGAHRDQEARSETCQAL
jgi:hypothetical protein